MDYYVIAEREILLGFSLAGIAGAAVSNQQEAQDAFRLVTGCGNSPTIGAPSSRPRVLILTETVAQMLEDEVLAWQMKAAYPLIVEIPGLQGRVEGKKSLSNLIQEAIGIQI